MRIPDRINPRMHDRDLYEQAQVLDRRDADDLRWRRCEAGCPLYVQVIRDELALCIGHKLEFLERQRWKEQRNYQIRFP